MRNQLIAARAGERGFSLTEVIVIILIISILIAMAVILLGKSETDAAYNSAAQQSVHLGTASAKSAYYGNRQNLPVGPALQSDLSEGEPGLVFTVYDATTHSTDSKNVSYTRDWEDQATVCAKSHTGYYYCERTTYGQSRLELNAASRSRGDTVNRSRCVGLSEPSTRACLADSNHPAHENGEARVGWSPGGLDEPGDGSSTSYLTEVMTDAPSFYCSLDDDPAPLPTPMSCLGSSFAEWNGVAGSVTLGSPGALVSRPSATAASFNGTAQTSSATPSGNALNTDGSEWTFEGWIKKDGGSGQGVLASVDETIAIRLAGASGIRADWKRVNGGVSSLFSNTAQINPGDPWTYVAIVWDQPDMKFYVNGVQTNSQSFSSGLYPKHGPAAQVMRPGYVSGAWTGGDVLTGEADELAFYPTALSAGRIAAHYAAAGY